MYITYDRETKRVSYIGEKEPLALSENLECAEVETLPEKYDFLTVENVREETRTWVETVEEPCELSDEVTAKEIEHTDTFKIAEVKANFITLTDEQIEVQKQAEYKSMVDHLVRKKYSISDEFSIQRQRFEKPEEFAEYNAYVEECKALAKSEMDFTKG